MRYCSQCGAQLPPNARYCETCGAGVTGPQATGGYAAVTGPSSTSGGNGGGRAGVIVPVVVIVVALLAVAVVGGLSLRGGDEDKAADAVTSLPAPSSGAPQPSTTSPSSTSDPSPETTTVTQSASSTTESSPSSSDESTSEPQDGDAIVAQTPSSDTEAEATLDRAAAADLRDTDLDSTWAAQVASPYVGATDDAIQPGPLSATDILNHHRGQRSDPMFGGSKVVLLRQNTFGEIYPNKKKIWVTLVLTQKSSKQQVREWCASTFSMSEKDAADVCIPRQLTPPHS